MLVVCPGLGMGLIQSPSAARVTLIVPKHQLGVALGIFNTLPFVGVTLSATVCSILLERFSPVSVVDMADFQCGLMMPALVIGARALLAFITAPVKTGERR